MGRKVTIESHEEVELKNEQRTWKVPTVNGGHREGTGELPQHVMDNNSGCLFMVLIMISIAASPFAVYAMTRRVPEKPPEIPATGTEIPHVPPSGLPFGPDPRPIRR